MQSWAAPIPSSVTAARSWRKPHLSIKRLEPGASNDRHRGRPGADGAVTVISIPSVTSNWHDTTGGTGLLENVCFGRYDAEAGDGFNQVRWGTPFTGSVNNGRSGLGFKGLAPISPVAIDTAFQIGELRHSNWTILVSSAATGSQLDLSASLEIDGVGSPGSP